MAGNENIAILGLAASSDGVAAVTKQMQQLESASQNAAKELGAVSSGLETVTQKAKASTQLMEGLTKAMKFVSFVNELDKASKILANFEKTIARLKTGFLALAASPVGWITVATTALYALWESIKAGEKKTEKFADRFGEVAERVGLTVEKYKELKEQQDIQEREGAEKKVRETNRAYEEQIENLDNLIAKYVKQRDEIGKFSDSYHANMQKAITALDAYKKAVEDAGGDQEKLNHAHSVFKGDLSDARQSGVLKGFVEEMGTLGEAIFVTATEALESREKFAGLGSGVKTAGESAASAEKNLDELAEAFKNVADAQKLGSTEKVIEFLTRLTGDSKEAEKASILLKKAQALEAVQLLETAAAANVNTAAMMGVRAENLAMAGASDEVVDKLMEQARAFLDSAREARVLAQKGSDVLADPNHNWAGEMAKNIEDASKKSKDAISSLEDKVKSMKAELAEDKEVGYMAKITSDLEMYEEAAAKATGKEKERLEGLISDYKRLDEQIAQKKAFGEADKALQDFEKRHQSVFGNAIDLTESIRVEMEGYRQAVVASNKSEAEKEKILERILELEKRLNKEASKDWADGITRAVEKYTDEAKDLAKQTESAFTSLFNGLDSGFKSMWGDFINKGKVSFSSMKDLFKNFLADLAHIALTRPIMVQIAGAVQGFFGLGGNAATAANVVASTTGGGGGLGSLGNLFSLGESIGALKDFIPTLWDGAEGTSTAALGKLWEKSFGGALEKVLPDAVKEWGYDFWQGGKEWLGISGTPTQQALQATYDAAASAAYDKALASGLDTVAADMVAMDAGQAAIDRMAGAADLFAAYMPVISALIAALPKLKEGDYAGATIAGGAAAAGAYTGMTLGAYLGSIIPVVGNAIGAAIGVAVGAAVGSIGNDVRSVLDGKKNSVDFHKELIVPTQYEHAYMSIFGGSIARTVEASREFNAMNTLSFFFGGGLGPIVSNLLFGKRESQPAVRGWLNMDLTGRDSYVGDDSLLESQGSKRANYVNLDFAQIMSRANKNKENLWKAADGLFEILQEVAHGLLDSTQAMANVLPQNIAYQWMHALSDMPIETYGVFKGKNIGEKKIKAWIEDIQRDAEHLWVAAFQKVDFSHEWEYAGKLVVDQYEGYTDDFYEAGKEGMEKFIKAIQGMEAMNAIIDSIEKPLGEFTINALESIDKMNAHRAEYLDDLGWTDDTLAETMSRYSKALIDAFIKPMEESIHPLPQLEQSLKDLNDQFADLTRAAREFGATQEDLVRINDLQVAAINKIKQQMDTAFWDNYNLRTLALVGGDTELEQLKQNQRKELESVAAEYGSHSPDGKYTYYEYTEMLQEAELLQFELGRLQNSVDQAEVSLESFAGALESAKAVTTAAFSALVDGVNSAVETAKNGIKAAIDAWVNETGQTYQAAAQSYLSALNADLNLYKNILSHMNSSRTQLWTDESLNDIPTVYESAKQQLEASYTKALAGDADALDDFTSMAKTFLSASMNSQGEYSAYRDDFYAVQDMINTLQGDAGEQVEKLKTEIELVEAQLEISTKTNKTLSELKFEMDKAFDEMNRALAEQTSVYAEYGFKQAESLEQQYRDAVVQWLELKEFLTSSGLHQYAALTASSTNTLIAKLEQLRSDWLDAQSKAAKAQEDYAKQQASYDNLLAQLTNKQNQIENSTTPTEKIWGTNFATEKELIQEKVNRLNTSERSVWENDAVIKQYLADRNLTQWTPYVWTEWLKREYDGMTVKEWYDAWGHMEGFATGGTASGWALVGEQGPELAYFGDSAKIYTASQTHQMLMAPAETDGSPEAMRAMVQELKEQNGCLHDILDQVTSVQKNTKSAADSLDDVVENGVATFEQQATNNQPTWAD